MSRSEHLASRRLCESQEDSEDQPDVRAASAAWCGRMSANDGMEILPKATTSVLLCCVDVQILTHTNEMLQLLCWILGRVRPQGLGQSGMGHGGRRCCRSVLVVVVVVDCSMHGSQGGEVLLKMVVVDASSLVQDFLIMGRPFNASMAGDVIMMLNLVEPRLWRVPLAGLRVAEERIKRKTI